MDLPDRIRGLFRGSGGTPPSQGSTAAPAGSKIYDKEILSTRQSRGLEQFFEYIQDRSGLTILDLSGLTQANVNFITARGHRLYSEDFLKILQDTFRTADPGEQTDPSRIEFFLSQSLDYPEDHFDAVLVWDVLEYLQPVLLSATIERLWRITRPHSYLLAFFHADPQGSGMVPIYSFRIQDPTTLQVAQRGLRRPMQLFNNRSLEKMFGSFESVKFFLTREHLREVLVKR